MSDVKKLPLRSQVAVGDCWDLSSLYASDQAWEADFRQFEQQISGYDDYRGRLGESAQTLAECLQFDLEIDQLAERLGTYAFLKTAEDQANQTYQALVGRFQSVAVKASQIASYMRPEILEIPAAQMQEYMDAPVLADFKLVLERIVRYRAHTLSNAEESLLAMQGEMAQTASKAFRQLNDADLKFGSLDNGEGQEIELSHATFSEFMKLPHREVRKAAFEQYYERFADHENTLAAMLAGTIHGDVYYAKARKYPSALDAALFPITYHAAFMKTIESVHSQLPQVRSTWTSVGGGWGSPTCTPTTPTCQSCPILNSVHGPRRSKWSSESLKPLGSEYCRDVTKWLERSVVRSLSQQRQAEWCLQFVARFPLIHSF
ncbi:MAG: hypothetical protein R3C53_17515 [Pirellulaceae bacterium]